MTPAVWLHSQLERGERERFCIASMGVTPAIASAMLDLNSANRPLRSGRVALLARSMTEGRWKLTPEAISFHNKGGLLNGQHRLAAVVASGVTVLATLWFGCDPSEFTALDRNAVRGVSDDLALMGYDRWTVRASSAQVLLRIKLGSTANVDPAHVVQFAVSLASPELDRALLYGERARKMVAITSATVAFYVIQRDTKHPGKMDEFWECFCTGANLPPKSAVLKLRDWLRDNISARNGRDRNVKDTAALIIAWNSWVRGKTAPSFAWSQNIKFPEVV